MINVVCSKKQECHYGRLPWQDNISDPSPCWYTLHWEASDVDWHVILKFLKTVHPVGPGDFAEDFGPLWGRQQLLQLSLCLSHWICTRSICKRGDERPFWVPILYMASRIGISIHLFLLVLHYEAKEQIFQEHETQPKKQVEWSEPAWRSWFQRCLSDTSFVCFSIRLCMYIVQYMKWSFKRTHG